MSTTRNMYDQTVSLSSGQLNTAYNSAVTSLNSGLYNLSQQQQTSTPKTSIWDTVGNALGAAAGVANIITGVKTQTPVVQTINGNPNTSGQPAGQTVIYQQAPEEDKTNWLLIGGIIFGVILIAVILIIVFKKNKGGNK